MTHEYAPASDVTLAFFRRDVERSDEQLESIMVSRVVMGEILARIDQAESDRDLAHDDWQDAVNQLRRCDGCSEPNRCGCPTSAEAPSDV